MLVAIAIPIFTTQLEKSRDAVTVSNLRAAYAEAATEVLTSDTQSVTKTIVCKGKNADGLSNLEKELPFTVSADDAKALNDSTGKSVTFTWADNSDAPPTFKVN